MGAFKVRSIHLTEPQAKTLGDLSEKTGLPVSEIIRRAVDEYLGQQEVARRGGCTEFKHGESGAV